MNPALVAVGMMAGLLAAIPAAARPHPASDRGTDLVHSDVPLWTFKDPEFYPQGFVEKDSWGCSSRVALGTWHFTPSPDGPGASVGAGEEWWILANYGVFHCALIERRSSEPFAGPSSDERAAIPFRHSWIVKIGSLVRDGQALEIWVLQSGSRPGSDHTLLLRAPGTGLIRHFEVLQRSCPGRFEREGVSLDIWGTRYCAINTRRDLVAFARAMAQRPSLGTLEFQPSSEPDKAGPDERE